VAGPAETGEEGVKEGKGGGYFSGWAFNAGRPKPIRDPGARRRKRLEKRESDGQRPEDRPCSAISVSTLARD